MKKKAKKTRTLSFTLTTKERWFLGWNSFQDIVDRENAKIELFKKEESIEGMVDAVWKICTAKNPPSVMLLTELRRIVKKRFGHRDEAAERLARGIEHAIPFFARGMTSVVGYMYSWGKYLRHDVIFPPAQEAEKAA